MVYQKIVLSDERLIRRVGIWPRYRMDLGIIWDEARSTDFITIVFRPRLYINKAKPGDIMQIK